MTSTMVVTGEPHPKVAVRRYLYTPGVATVWLNVAPLPDKEVQVPKPGPVALSQLYVGPEEAGVPVEAEVEFVILTLPPAQISVPAMAPGLCTVE